MKIRYTHSSYTFPQINLSMDLLKNIDNKEIFVEVLHLAVDYLIGNITEKQTLRLSHKYGFQNPYDFLLAIRSLSAYYMNYNLDINRAESSILFSYFSPEMNRLVPVVFAARQPEVATHKLKCSKDTMFFMESFSWDTRLILGDSRFGENVHQVITLNLSCRQNKTKRIVFFEMNKINLNSFICLLENMLEK
ncbi:uncharacterized protein [Drosophila pseudoobscura]|uniref:Uncharacterized protein isoform X1 n=3 Tax=pseudoobscura subgroup TaxID=32358 RepID=A0A0R3NWH6_DROPS|nr:uncharacterized protein LOC26532749 isoform X1 [Drosophila pseudoobscura]